ncbi:hypothetical protein HU200_049282 [Digitaria exilis]|uniref:SHSP domain-containing protein n=1 Tax=Digitaria exilis TaxID=1010633 RepID=A0A835E9X0_9POAL|nr:hypothetical protein HU200_049282 [Digitaria exilis]CAB3499571.1 unnamed protein product [Digitaria exilis]
MDSNGRVFEDFVPPHSMVREPATHTLTVDLANTGKHARFKKEHIRVQMVHSHRRLIVRGERPVAGNRWSRFRLELRVPDGCDAKAIHARFENGVVRVTMPGGAAPEPIQAETGGAAARQDTSPAPVAKPSAAAIAGAPPQQDGDDGRAARGGGGDHQVEGEKKDEPAAQKQEMRQRVTSAKDDGGHDEDDAGAVGEVTAASPSRQGYGFLQDRRRKMATTMLGVVLVLMSLGIYVKYSLCP